MRLTPYFILLLCVSLLYTGCKKDDDGDDNGDGTGDDLRISLTWQQTDADLDLDIVSDPLSRFIGPLTNASNITHSGDDLTGPGEEVIRYDNNAPDGRYRVRVEWFSGDDDVRYTLRIQSAEKRPHLHRNHQRQY
ncbi:MAG: hypothetical protein HC821_02450 [Lewinella sp.]|nr:hypothetical protein [Lewinella sp.]